MIREILFGRGEITERLQFFGWIRPRLEFKLQDMWIGVYWKSVGHAVDVWVCLIPCVPIHFTLLYHDPEQ